MSSLIINDQISLGRHNWGECVTENLAEVLKCTIDYFDGVLIPNYRHNIECLILSTEQNHPECCPTADYQQHVILLSAKDRKWDKYTYQFSHEYCHHLINIVPLRNLNGAFWFEETICELASLYCLKKNEVLWNIKPPYENWRSYSLVYAGYFDATVSDRDNLTGSIGQYIRKKLPLVERPEYERKIYLTIAYHILDLFWKYPILWNIILFFRCTNYKNKEQYINFYDFLDELESVIPDCIRPSYTLLKRRLIE